MRKLETHRVRMLLAATTGTLLFVGSASAQSANPVGGTGATGTGASAAPSSALQPAESSADGSSRTDASSGSASGSSLNGRAAATDEPPTPTSADVQVLLSSIVNSVIAPQGASKLTDQLAGADARRLDGAGATSTLADTVAQLQKAYQAKYNRPLNISQDQAAVFPETSFRVGIAMAVVRDESEAAATTAPSTTGGTAASAETGAQQASAVSTPSAAASNDSTASSGASGAVGGTWSTDNASGARSFHFPSRPLQSNQRVPDT